MAAGDSLLVLKLLWPYYSYSKYNTRAAEEGGFSLLVSLYAYVDLHA